MALTQLPDKSVQSTVREQFLITPQNLTTSQFRDSMSSKRSNSPKKSKKSAARRSVAAEDYVEVPQAPIISLDLKQVNKDDAGGGIEQQTWTPSLFTPQNLEDIDKTRSANQEGSERSYVDKSPTLKQRLLNFQRYYYNIKVKLLNQLKNMPAEEREKRYSEEILAKWIDVKHKRRVKKEAGGEADDGTAYVADEQMANLGIAKEAPLHSLLNEDWIQHVKRNPGG